MVYDARCVLSLKYLLRASFEIYVAATGLGVMLACLWGEGHELGDVQ